MCQQKLKTILLHFSIIFVVMSCRSHSEKKPISDTATVGFYYWKHGSEFVKYAEKMIEKDIRVNNEFYVCPVFNQAIKDNKKIKIFNVKKMWGLGTPEDLDFYVKNFN